MSYSSIKQNGYWKDTANSLNYNFNKIDTQISSLEGKVTKSKGLFKTSEELTTAFPNPQPGDWALVGSSLPAQLWTESDGAWVDSGGTSGSTIDIDLTEYTKSEVITNPSDILDLFEVSINVTSSKIVEYTGENQTVNISWTTKENGEPVTSNVSLFKITKDDFQMPVGENYNSATSTSVNKEGTTTFAIQAAINGGETISSEVEYSQYRAMYFGTSSKLNPQDITFGELTKQEIKTSSTGTYSINNVTGTGNYLWLCIPTNMNINSISYVSGENIPFSVTLRDNYKFYKSENPVKDENPININIVG